MRTLAIVLLAGALAVACKTKDPEPGSAPQVTSPKPTPRTEGGPVVLGIVYGSEKKSWLEEQAKAFEATGPKTSGGRPIKIERQAMGSGEAMQGILSGKLKPTVFSPASGVYVSLLNQGWLQAGGHTRPLASAGEPLVLSPVVIAMWRPMAEALGWPGKRLGWADLLAVNADPRGWGAHGHTEWGRFKLGHTHPAFSNSGVLAVLAEAYAGAKKKRGLTADDLGAKDTVALVTAVEQTIVHYGKSTGFFADKMLERGPSYLSAAVLYENLVIESYAKSPPVPFVAIYPLEGTFWSDHPWSVLDAEWVTPEQRQAADAFLAFLKARPAQVRALELGFRPADPGIAIGAPVDAAHGVDPKQPETLLEIPDADVLAKLVELWQRHKKPTAVVLVFDKSGSMHGRPLDQAKAGAKAFLDTLHDDDDVTILPFSSRIEAKAGPWRVRDHRADLVATIDALVAGGGTALYDAVSSGYEQARQRAAKEPDRIHAVVVMTDGRDEDSRLSLRALAAKLTDEAVKVFTIGYGAAVDDSVLGQIAEAARGAHENGSVENIAAVFEDMGAFL
jgi:Ca-activated chloride channel family protein